VAVTYVTEGRTTTRKQIDVERAMALFERGYTYGQIGAILAKSEGRRMAYHHDSVRHACRTWEEAGDIVPPSAELWARQYPIVDAPRQRRARGPK